ncbi:MAG: bifunctional riboflavin kinase/FAD synthetase [Ruminococcaceae bacterium]|nr:bifunctional riboflavin kinase/FAD synthetase [Oscillospiraceae bacterium]
MQIFFETPSFKKPTIVALGNFDGVHLGHEKLIKTLVENKDLESVVYTFSKHPLCELFGDGKVKYINTNTEKAELFEEMGVENLIFQDFGEVRYLTPEEFVKTVLVDRLLAKEIVCGFNYKFGKNNTGDVSVLRNLLEAFGVKLTVIDEVMVNGKTASSSAVRQALSNGNMEEASELMGHPYFLSSKVVHGKALGRKLGFPTINEKINSSRLVIPFGVYFGRCVIPEEKKEYFAVINVGVRPTVNSTDKTPSVEAHIIDFDGDLYEKKVRIEFMKKSRDEIKFPTVEELKKQIEKDISNCKSYFLKGEI